MLLSLLTLTGCGKLPGQPNPDDRPVRPDQMTDFRTLFRENCQGCHGADGRMGPAPPLNDKLFLTIAPESSLREIITNGRHGTLMPAFLGFDKKQADLTNRIQQREGGHLTDTQIDAIVKGMRAEWGGKPDVSAPLPSYLADDPKAKGALVGDKDNGADVYMMACAGCHGDNGEGGKRGGKLNDPAFLALVSDQLLRRIVITGRADLGMPNFADPAPAARPKSFAPMTNQDVADVVALLASWRKPAPPAPAK
ncbi:MAG: c-type cytochrome [Gemmataceae bacterium]|nr:c-type cytochrome [Gemmataceae bacterium]